MSTTSTSGSIMLLREGVAARLRAPVWKAFDFGEGGQFLLHVPSAYIFEAPLELVTHVRDGTPDDPDLDRQLTEIASRLPKARQAEVKVDIKAIALNVAQSCNLRCTYCYAGDGDYGKVSRMSFETAKATIDFFARDQTDLYVLFFGGEPMLNMALVRKVVEYCECLGACRFKFGMTTNATLLNDSIMEYLRAKNFSLTISYDGQGLHARQRLNSDRKTNSEQLVAGKIKHYEKDLATLRDMQLRGTIARENLDLFAAALASTVREFNLPVTFSHHATSDHRQGFGAAEVAKLGQAVRTVVDELVAAKDYAALKRLTFLWPHIKRFHKGKVGDMFCGAGVNYLSVSTSGKFYLCHRFTEDESEAVGSLGEGLNHLKLQQYAEHRNKKLDPCASCWMREWCAGGCFHEHKAATGKAFETDPVFCTLQDMEMELAMRLYAHVLKEAPGLIEG